MKKIIAIALILVMLMTLVLTGCGNMTIIDTVYTFNRAIIELPTGEVIEVDVREWGTYEGEQIQIKATDGKVYLTSSYNCVLICD